MKASLPLPVTLTERVIWAVTATVALLVGTQSLLAFMAMHVQEDEMSDAMLRREVQQIVSHTVLPGLTPTGQLVASTTVSAWLVRAGAGASEMPGNMRALGPGVYQLQPEGRTLHVAVTDTDDGRLTVALDATVAEDRVDRFGWILLALWVVCVGATVLIARAVAGLAVEPIVLATRAIALSAPGEPMAPAERSDEAGVLIETFGRFRDRVDDMVAREREFAANLDHEIRTPLTTIRTDAELLGLEVALAPAQQARLERIASAVDEIGATTEAALAFSAGRLGLEEVGLEALIRSAASAMAERAAARGLVIAVGVAGSERVGADRQALLTVVRNLIRNAVEHAAPATLVIRGDARRLVFEDDGPGIRADVLSTVFDRHRHGHRHDEAESRPGGRRRGLGLDIARRLCELQQWQLDVSSPGPSGRGSSFTLEFAPRR